jgi:ribose transport system permease protein
MAAGPPSSAGAGVTKDAPAPRTPSLRPGGAAAWLRVPRFSAIWVATALLFAISPLLAHGSVSHSALLSMAPFAAILAVAAIGQTLVVQQRGLDLSVPGVITLATIIVTKYCDGHDGRLPLAIGLVALASIAAGVVSGIAITWFGITPLVATLGVNALLQGVVFQITSGSSTAAAPPALARFALEKTLSVPNTVVIAVIGVIVTALVIRTTIAGRRFVATGASPAAARAGGIRVRRYELATYVLAALFYGAAGILVAGFLGTPGIGAGDGYLLPTIAAVVLGGTSLAGGVGSVVATAGGALFLTQLQQVVLGMGAPSSLQFVIQGSIIAVGMGLRNLPWDRVRELVTRHAAGGGGQPAALAAETRSADLRDTVER